ncbi:MAG TPA: RhuM family protein [Gallionella sp.]|nr:RhuM family protein [Gallionella sp.]
MLSVGYRVNSKRGTQFRQWATRVLREHLVQGYTLNQSRLAEWGLSEAQQSLELLARTLGNQALVSDAGGDVTE